MLTSNFWSGFSVLFDNGFAKSGSTFPVRSVYLDGETVYCTMDKWTDGTNGFIGAMTICGGLIADAENPADRYYYGGIGIGSGTTPPTRNDYKLENDIPVFVDSNYTVQRFVLVPSARVSYGTTENSMDVTTTVAITANEDITVSEIGIYGSAYEITSSNTMVHGYLLERTVLDEPVTIRAGETKSIQYTIRFGV